jgi:hypothetical protein
MLASHKERVDDLIVEALAERPAQTAADLLARVQPLLDNELTSQGWYKALRRLIAQEVLIKIGKTYSLNTRWILSVIRWAEQAERTHLTHPQLPTIRLPKGRERITYRFKNLLEMDTFWGHLLVYIAARAKKPRVLYAYNPHFWFYLAHEQSEKEYNKGMNEFGVKTVMLIGSKSFLDRWNAQFFDRFIYSWLHPSALFQDTSRHYNYLDGYFMEVRIAPEAAREIDALFLRVKTIGDVSPLELIRIFHTRRACSITLSKSRAKGEKLKMRVERYLAKKQAK